MEKKESIKLQVAGKKHIASTSANTKEMAKHQGRCLSSAFSPEVLIVTSMLIVRSASSSCSSTMMLFSTGFPKKEDFRMFSSKPMKEQTAKLAKHPQNRSRAYSPVPKKRPAKETMNKKMPRYLQKKYTLPRKVNLGSLPGRLADSTMLKTIYFSQM